MTDEKTPSETYALNDSLKKVVAGTGLALIGQLLSYFFGLLVAVLIARHWTESDVGVFSLAYAVLNICMTISFLGMTDGVVRSIAHSQGKNEQNKIPDFISTSIFFSLFISLILGLIVFLLSNVISVNIFHEINLILPLKIFAIALPFYTLGMIIISIFRGFGLIKPMVIRAVIASTLFLAFVGVVIYLNFSFIYVFYSYLVSGIIVFIILVIYSFKQSTDFKIPSIKLIVSPAAKELIIFSIPLLGTTMIVMIVSWTDTLMLGGLKDAANVGFYHVGQPFSTFISFPLAALLIAFVPVFSGLYAKGLINDMKKNYLILTKWICLSTLPIFIIFFLFPELIISAIVGPNYLPSANVLRILSLAFITGNFAGPCGATLLVLGKPRFIMFTTIFTAILNVVLNAILIPSYSFIGAAYASGTAFISTNVIKTWKMYSISKIQPLSWNLIKPTLFSIIFIIPIYFFGQRYLPYNLFSIDLLLIVFYSIYLISILLTKSLDEEDLKMLLAIERKTGLKIKRIKKFISRFL
jgi:O-antigen/teichoic acid export membrane protein